MGDAGAVNMDGHTVPSLATNNSQDPGDIAKPLNISIAGAGLGGLTAAIALRRAGHKVTVRLHWFQAPVLHD
jgi:NADPH-dependent 2,4-dienoyl-CoA reductase/sulfur reductase-like enzyme